MCMYMGVHVCVRVLVWVFRVYLYIFMCWSRATVFRVRLVRSEPVAEDLNPNRIRAVVDPIHKQSEDQCMG